MPVAVTENITLLPERTVWLIGDTVMLGAVLVAAHVKTPVRTKVEMSRLIFAFIVTRALWVGENLLFVNSITLTL